MKHSFMILMIVLFAMMISFHCATEETTEEITVLKLNKPVFAIIGSDAPMLSDRPYYDIPLLIEENNLYQLDAFAATTDLDLTMSLIKKENNSEIGFDDDTGGNRNPRIQALLENGEYIVRISTYNNGDVDQELQFAVLATLNSPVALSGNDVDPPAVIESIQTGQTIHGSLTGENTTQLGQSYADYAFTVDAPGVYEINAISVDGEEEVNEVGSSLDLKLLVLSANATQKYGEDDDSGENNNPSLQQALLAGEYLIRITTFGSINTGNYQLLIEKVD